MAQKRFQGSMFGFSKGAVNTYIENLTRDYEEKLTSKDMELEKLIAQLKKVNKKYETIKLEEERILAEKEKISQALVSANEKADKIIDEAKSRVAVEVTELEAAAEKEREKIVDIKRELKDMKSEASGILEKFEKSINGIIISSVSEMPVEDSNDNKEPVEAEEIVMEAAADVEEKDDFFG